MRLLGSKPTRAKQPVEPLRWTSHRGDEWWCDDAEAGYSSGNFTIGSFGKYTAADSALELIRAARSGLPDATIDIHLDGETEPVVKMLVERGLIGATEIQLSPRMRVARVTKVLG
jgi:hypothetical protein